MTGRLRTAGRWSRVVVVLLTAAGLGAVRGLVRRTGVKVSALSALGPAFSRLGGAFPKLGQLVAASSALVGDEVATAFSGTFDRGRPLPLRVVRRAAAGAFGSSLAGASLEVSPVRLGAASVAVVHRGRLRDGRDVAVKVLRPGIASAMERDLRGFAWLGRVAARRGAGDGLLEVVEVLRAQLHEEVDLPREAHAMDRFRIRFADAGLDLLVVPEVIAVSDDALVMTCVEGVSLGEPDGLARLGWSPAQSAEAVEQLLRSLYLGMLRDGDLHGDFHGGNLLALADGRVAVVDWGIVAQLDDGTRELLRALIRGALGDESAWASAVELVEPLVPGGLPGMGMTAEEFAQVLRMYCTLLFAQPFRMAGLGMFKPSETPGTGPVPASPVEPDPSPEARTRRRGTLMVAKQLIYLEGFAKRYLPDATLLDDADFLRSLVSLEVA